jgi:hypothetical protein
MSYERSLCHAPARVTTETQGAHSGAASTISLSRGRCGQPCVSDELSTISLSRVARSLCHGLASNPTITLSRNPIVKNL